ncbi:hypothetical protein CJ030_MR5G009626 [Morella rubra]|uniref:Uncharacterized protein n=1 Tax=Morella rubra TaxID=262757 RepID=A0A6A1VK47_9ROSI|nr:hypothetical protein CJ030_MR5G009626 [Morella rubra]
MRHGKGLARRPQREVILWRSYLPPLPEGSHFRRNSPKAQRWMLVLWHGPSESKAALSLSGSHGAGCLGGPDEAGGAGVGADVSPDFLLDVFGKMEAVLPEFLSLASLLRPKNNAIVAAQLWGVDSSGR